MRLGDLLKQLFTSRRDRWDSEGSRMMAYVQETGDSEGGPGESARQRAGERRAAAAGPVGPSTEPGARASTKTSVRSSIAPDGSVTTVRVERHEEFRIIAEDGTVRVYDDWSDVPAELRAILRRTVEHAGP